MRQFLDGGWFPTDRIPDYCQSLPPPGDQAFYWSFAQLGLEPLNVARILPVILAWVTTAIGLWLIASKMEVHQAQAIAFLTPPNILITVRTTLDWRDIFFQLKNQNKITSETPTLPGKLKIYGEALPKFSMP